MCEVSGECGTASLQVYERWQSVGCILRMLCKVRMDISHIRFDPQVCLVHLFNNYIAWQVRMNPRPIWPKKFIDSQRDFGLELQSSVSFGTTIQ